MGNLRLIFVASIVLIASPVAAQSRLALSGDVGLGAFDGAMHTTVQSGVAIDEGGLSIALFGRVRLVMHDHDSRGVVRRRDYDEVTDYLSILRRLRYQRRFDSVTLRASTGRLLGTTLGHGTIVRDYSNVADVDHPRPGARFELSHARFDLALMVDNFVKPSLIAGRLALRPVPALAALSFGASLAIDPRAPVRVQLDGAGQRVVDSAYNLQSDDTALVVGGLDVEYLVGRRGHGVMPYFDFNVSGHGSDSAGNQLGFGVHAGVRGAVELDKVGRTRLTARGEFRYAGAAYAPAWFQTFYDLERYQASLALPASSVSPDGTRLSAAARQGQGVGALGELGLRWRDRLSLRLGYAYAPMPDPHRIFVRFSTQPHWRVRLAGLLVVRGIGEPGADIARGISALAEARVSITKVFYALGQYTRLWSLDADTRVFGTLSGFNIAIGARWSG